MLIKQKQFGLGAWLNQILNFQNSFCLERFPLPLGTLDGLRCFVIALPQPSMWLFFKIYDYCDVLRTLYL